MTKIVELPSELLCDIFSYIKDAKTIRNVRQVNKLFNQLIHRDVFWKLAVENKIKQVYWRYEGDLPENGYYEWMKEQIEIEKEVEKCLRNISLDDFHKICSFGTRSQLALDKFAENNKDSGDPNVCITSVVHASEIDFAILHYRLLKSFETIIFKKKYEFGATDLINTIIDAHHVADKHVQTEAFGNKVDYTTRQMINDIKKIMCNQRVKADDPETIAKQMLAARSKVLSDRDARRPGDMLINLGSCVLYAELCREAGYKADPVLLVLDKLVRVELGNGTVRFVNWKDVFQDEDGIGKLLTKEDMLTRVTTMQSNSNEEANLKPADVKDAANVIAFDQQLTVRAAGFTHTRHAMVQYNMALLNMMSRTDSMNGDIYQKAIDMMMESDGIYNWGVYAMKRFLYGDKFIYKPFKLPVSKKIIKQVGEWREFRPTGEYCVVLGPGNETNELLVAFYVPYNEYKEKSVAVSALKMQNIKDSRVLECAHIYNLFTKPDFKKARMIPSRILLQLLGQPY